MGDERAHAARLGEGERFAVVSLPPAASKHSGSLATAPRHPMAPNVLELTLLLLTGWWAGAAAR